MQDLQLSDEEVQYLIDRRLKKKEKLENQIAELQEELDELDDKIEGLSEGRNVSSKGKKKIKVDWPPIVVEFLKEENSLTVASDVLRECMEKESISQDYFKSMKPNFDRQVKESEEIRDYKIKGKRNKYLGLTYFFNGDEPKQEYKIEG